MTVELSAEVCLMSEDEFDVIDFDEYKKRKIVLKEMMSRDEMDKNMIYGLFDDGPYLEDEATVDGWEDEDDSNTDY